MPKKQRNKREITYIQCKYNYFGLQMQVNTMFIVNNQCMPFQISKWIHSNWQKKHKLTKVKMDRPTTKKTEEIWNGLYPAAAVADYDNMLVVRLATMCRPWITSEEVDGLQWNVGCNSCCETSQAFSVHAVKEYRAVAVQLCWHLTSALHGGELSVSCPDWCTLGKRAPCAPQPVWKHQRKENVFPMSGI